MSNTVPDFNSVKAQIKQIVWENETNRWKASCLMYTELDCYTRSVSRIRMHPWWLFLKQEPIYCNKVASIMSLLVGGQPIKYQRNFGHTRCGICEYFDYESIEHILFTCITLEPYRTTLWENVLSKMTDPLKMSIIRMTNRDKVKFILSCYSESYVDEWKALYRATADFVYKMYVYRAGLYDNAN